MVYCFVLGEIMISVYSIFFNNCVDVFEKFVVLFVVIGC